MFFCAYSPVDHHALQQAHANLDPLLLRAVHTASGGDGSSHMCICSARVEGAAPNHGTSTGMIDRVVDRSRYTNHI